MKLLELERETASGEEDTCPPLDKGDKSGLVYGAFDTLKLRVDDLDKALGLFRGVHGVDPALIGIVDDKENEAIIAEARGRGFEVSHPLGGLAFEVWLYRKRPVKPRKRRSNGFFCKGCLEDRDEEAGEGYCRECLDVVKADQRALGSKDFWSGDCLIFFHFGVGYALTDELHTVKLGAEADVLEALRIGQIPDSISGLSRKVLAEIIDDRRDYGTGKTGLVRAGNDGTVGGKSEAIGRSAPGKVLALRASQSKGKAVLCR